MPSSHLCPPFSSSFPSCHSALKHFHQTQEVTTKSWCIYSIHYHKRSIFSLIYQIPAKPPYLGIPQAPQTQHVQNMLSSPKLRLPTCCSSQSAASQHLSPRPESWSHSAALLVTQFIILPPKYILDPVSFSLPLVTLPTSYHSQLPLCL